MGLFADAALGWQRQRHLLDMNGRLKRTLVQ